MNKLRKLTKLVILLSLFLFLLQIWVANRLTIAGSTFTRLAVRKESLREENNFLETKIASASSLAQIAQLSRIEGFTKANFLYLENQIPVALGNSTTNVAR